MKSFLAALVVTLVLSQPVLAAEPPAGVVKFRKCLETLRNDLLKYQVRVQNVFYGDDTWTQKDTEYLNSHTTDEDASNVGTSGAMLIESLETAIVKLGGHKNLNEQESTQLLQDILNENKQ